MLEKGTAMIVQWGRADGLTGGVREGDSDDSTVGEG